MSNPATVTSSPGTVDGLTNGLQYQVRVRARNAMGYGPWSSLSAPFTPHATTTFTQQATTDGATHLWSAPASGTSVPNEITGGANPMTVHGTVTYGGPSLISTEPSSSSILLGSSGYLQATDAAALETNTFSIAFVFQATAIGGVQTLLRKEGPQYALRLTESGVGGFIFNTGGQMGPAAGVRGRVAANTTHIAHMVVNSTTGKTDFYLDGHLSDALSGQWTTLASSVYDLYVGGSFGDSAEKFTGRFGKMAFFSGIALTRAQINAQVQAALGVAPSPIEAFRSNGDVNSYTFTQFSVGTPTYSHVSNITDQAPAVAGDTGRSTIEILADERDRGEVGTNGVNGVVRGQAVVASIMEQGVTYWEYLEVLLPTDLPQGVGGFWVLTLNDDHPMPTPNNETDVGSGPGTGGTFIGPGLGIYDTGSNGIDQFQPGAINILRPGYLGVWHKFLRQFKVANDQTGFLKIWWALRPNPFPTTPFSTTTGVRTTANSSHIYPKIASYRPGLQAGWDNTAWASKIWFGQHQILEDGAPGADLVSIDPDQ